MKVKVNQGNGSLKLDFSKNSDHIIFQQKKINSNKTDSTVSSFLHLFEHHCGESISVWKHIESQIQNLIFHLEH